MAPMAYMARSPRLGGVVCKHPPQFGFHHCLVFFRKQRWVVPESGFCLSRRLPRMAEIHDKSRFRSLRGGEVNVCIRFCSKTPNGINSSQPPSRGRRMQAPPSIRVPSLFRFFSGNKGYDSALGVTPDLTGFRCRCLLNGKIGFDGAS